MTRPSSSIAVSLRLPLLAAGGVALAAGLYTALLLLGFGLPQDGLAAGPVRLGPILAEIHGPLMVLGFVGTLIALERAVALGARWALAAPACSGAGALALLAAGPTLPAKALLATAGVLLLGIYRALWRRQPGAALLAQAAGAFAWYAAALLWLAGLPIADLVPWLATFLVATIAGERLELAGMVRSGHHPQRWFLTALAALVGGATAATLWPEVGAYVFGAAVLAVVGWLMVFDVARRTIRARGLPRYVAAGLLAGYAWLAVAGVLWAGDGRTIAGARYDAILHAVFLGFTMSMIFVHAPVILPAILRRPLPYRPVLYAPLFLLHASLVVRVAIGDGLGVTQAWRWAGVANVAAVLGFAGCAAALAVRAGHAAPATATNTATATATATGTASPAVSAGASR